MSSIINTNINSLNAQRNLGLNQMSLAASMQRLSSGLRINSAKDDAAGLAISERFTTQIRGLNQAVRNANDGISLSQTAEGALAEVTSNLQRIRELAVQSANATNSTSDRAALNQEVTQRLAEIDRVASQTSFNGSKVLDGSFGNATFQVGADVGQTISIGLNTSMRQSAIGAAAAVTSTTLNTIAGTPATASTATMGGFTQATSSASGQVFTFKAGTTTIFTKTTTTAVENVTAAEIDGATGLGSATVQSSLAAAGITFSGTAQAGTLVFSKADGTSFTTAITSTFATAPGVFATGIGATTNGVPAVSPAPVTVANNFSIAIGAGTAVNVANGSYTTAQSLVDAVNTAMGGKGIASIDATTGAMTISSSEAITVAGSVGNTTLGLAATTATSGSLLTVSVTDVASSNDAIQRVDSALTSVSTLRSTFGAIQNRFDSVIASLSTTSENLSASRSRVQDADFAAETANLSRAQILQQAGTAMVAQANQLPQGVLALLR